MKISTKHGLITVKSVTSLIVIVCILINCLGIKRVMAVNAAEEMENSFLAELADGANEVSYADSDCIDEMLERMNDIATSLINMTDTRLLAKTDYDIAEKEMNEYYKIKDKVESLGGIFLNGEQAIQYIYGGNLPMLKGTNIEYPSISGITFTVYYYVYKGEKLAKCVATQTPNVKSKLVKNYDPVVFYSGLNYKKMLKKGIEMTATRLVDYSIAVLSGGKVRYPVRTLAKLAEAVFPSESYTSDAIITLTVSTNSTVVHIWRYINDKYHLRTATVMAKITETWNVIDVNGDHHPFKVQYKSLSPHFANNDYAIEVTSSQSFGIYQEYRTEGFLGLYFKKLGVSPFIAALPIHFAD